MFNNIGVANLERLQQEWHFPNTIGLGSIAAASQSRGKLKYNSQSIISLDGSLSTFLCTSLLTSIHSHPKFPLSKGMIINRERKRGRESLCVCV